MVCYPAEESVPLTTAHDQEVDLEAGRAYQETDSAHVASSLPPPEYSSLINSHSEEAPTTPNTMSFPKRLILYRYRRQPTSASSTATTSRVPRPNPTPRKPPLPPKTRTRIRPKTLNSVNPKTDWSPSKSSARGRSTPRSRSSSARRLRSTLGCCLVYAPDLFVFLMVFWALILTKGPLVTMGAIILFFFFGSLFGQF
jgi:hypothetical protein